MYMQIVLPPAVARSSFQDTFSVFKEFNKVRWSALPLETLYDTDKIAAEWGKMGFHVSKTPPLQELPALKVPFPGMSSIGIHLYPSRH